MSVGAGLGDIGWEAVNEVRHRQENDAAVNGEKRWMVDAVVSVKKRRNCEPRGYERCN